jgi:transcriptional regulator with XRE-family HTH domain
MAFYQRIRDLREDTDKTQSEVAEFLGTTAQYYGKYEKGEREIPFMRAIQLADYYQVSLDYLAGRTNHKQGKANPNLTTEQIHVSDIYALLTDKNKGKLELLAEQMLEKQSEDSFR